VTTSALDERLRRPAGIRSLQLGELTVSYVPDGVVQLPGRGWLPDTTDDVWAAHPEYLDPTGALVASIGGLLVEHGDRALLIDAGVGPVTLPPDPSVPHGTIQGGALLDSLAALGRRPEDVDAVAITHLHPDHIGWAAHPGFAEILVSAQEWAHRDTTTTAAMVAHARTVVDGEEVFPGVHARVADGHTPGHTEYVISSGGQRLIAFGDAVHSPIQIDHPDWSAAVDHDPVRAAEHRRRLVAELAEPDTIGFGIHFADVVFGRVRPDGDGPAWQPLS
jgi:glyoxylase-like metal-dependent hydrolase (beta-lactamase superfamily II)